MSSEKPIKKAVAMHVRDGWNNVQLLKDCGLVPYLLHKNHGFSSTMVGAKKGEYPYLDTYVKGLQMEFLETGSAEENQNYVIQHAKDIDLFLCYGGYVLYSPLVQYYKALNPNGKVYMALDANSHWMDRIYWDDPDFIAMMNNCDVIATSCRRMQNHLNQKWPWKIEYLPNGYYKFDHQRDIFSYSQKENIILTVGRLGTPQKSTETLLSAFALITDKIPDWTLRLVGSVEEEFQGFLTNYFETYPALKERVQFAGVIADKAELYQEYDRAKIFALPSAWEGGTPNVVSEALHSGCVMAVTKFDAYEDAIDRGRCGAASALFDIPGFANNLLSLCQNPGLEELSQNAYQYALRTYDMEFVVKRLHYLLYHETN